MKKLVLAAAVLAFASPALACPMKDKSASTTPKPTTTAEKPMTPKPIKQGGSS